MFFTSEQFCNLASRYAKQIVDGMDVEEMEKFVYETIMDSIVGEMNDDELLDMIGTVFDGDILKEMVESVGVNPEEVIDI